jgi:hypothetical protein
LSGFFISDELATWGEFLGESTILEGVKMYIFYKVKLGFDPPTSSFVLSAMKDQILELEWRLSVQVETEAFTIDPVIPVVEEVV